MGGDRLRVELIEKVLRLPESVLERAVDLLNGLGRDEPQGLAAVPRAGEADVDANRKKAATSHSHSKVWPHAPLHRLTEQGTYIVTAATLHKEHYFRGEQRLDFLEEKLLELAPQYGWQLEAWAVFSNHYHFVGHSSESPTRLKEFLTQLHADTARDINREDHAEGREVWHNFWDTQLTFEKSYLARLNYVHQNAVRHRLVPVANQYRWCSAAWFERTSPPSQVKTIYSFKTDRVEVQDDFDPC